MADTLRVPVVRSAASKDWGLAEVADAATVRALTPDLGAVASLGRTGLIVTGPGDGDAAVVSRVFAPQSGIPEDPVTGAAHCALAPWWADRVGSEFEAEQASRRGGRLRVRLQGDRVELVGQAITVARGRLLA